MAIVNDHFRDSQSDESSLSQPSDSQSDSQPSLSASQLDTHISQGRINYSIRWNLAIKTTDLQAFLWDLDIRELKFSVLLCYKINFCIYISVCMSVFSKYIKIM